MSKCRQCNVEIKDQTQICPLCKCVVEWDDTAENRYPDIRFRVRKLSLAVRIFLFLAIILEILLGYLNYRFYHGTWWCVITGAGLAYLYFVARFAFLNNSAGYRSKLFALTFSGVAYVILIDEVIGYRGWSVNYVLPGGFLFVDLAIVILMMINRRNWQSYMMMEIFVMLLSAVPLLLSLLGIISASFISGLAFVVSALLFLGTVIIGDRRARMELRRRFHVR